MTLTELRPPELHPKPWAPPTGVAPSRPLADQGPREPRRRRSPSALFTLAGSVSWLVACLETRHADPGPSGLFPLLPIAWYVGILLIGLGLVTARRDREWEAAFALVALLTALTGTAAIVYDAPRYPWTPKHLGVVGYIRANGSVNERIDIYHSWPGFFSAIAGISDVVGLRDPMVLAMWWPAIIGTVRLVAFRFFCGRVIGPGYRCWLAAGLYVLTDSIGQDYFSPQSVGVVLALVIFGLCLPPAGEDEGSRARRLGVLFALSIAVTITHQLSPYFILLGVVVLVLFRLARPWWISLLVGVPPIAWALLHLSIIRRFLEPSQIGSVADNAHTQNSLGSLFGNGWVAAQVVALASGVVLLGVFAAMSLVRRHDRTGVALAVAAAAPVGLLVVNGYGNEALFRVVLFVLPWLAVLAVRPAGRHVLSGMRLTRLAVVPLLACYVISAFALEWAVAGRIDELSAVRQFEAQAPPGSVLIHTGMSASPSKSTARYFDFAWETRQNSGDFPASPYLATKDVEQFTTHLVNLWQAPAYYALVGESAMAKNALYGFMSAADYRQFAAAMADSPYWEPVFTRGGAILYRLRLMPRGYRPGQATLSRCPAGDCTAPAPDGVG